LRTFRCERSGIDISCGFEIKNVNFTTELNIINSIQSRVKIRVKNKNITFIRDKLNLRQSLQLQKLIWQSLFEKNANKSICSGITKRKNCKKVTKFSIEIRNKVRKKGRIEYAGRISRET
jgi:hypothetical protein